MRHRRPATVAGLALALVVALTTAGVAGCSEAERPAGPAPQPAPTTAAGSPSQGTAKDTNAGNDPDPPAVVNDLAKNPLARTLAAKPLTVTIAYSTGLPVKNWKPEVAKPLRVSVTAINRGRKGQRIYLSRVTASVSAYDASGLVDGPRALVDTANISPGFYVSFPNEYGQTFSLPSVDVAAASITVELTYEFVMQVSGDKATPRDFAKQTATDRITVPLA